MRFRKSSRDLLAFDLNPRKSSCPSLHIMYFGHNQSLEIGHTGPSENLTPYLVALL
jgi:hypothetical protein